MGVSRWLHTIEQRLSTAKIGTARLDALVLLEDASGKDRSWLLANPEFELTASQVKKLDQLVTRRASHEPLAYIRNKTEFYGREFYIDHRVLEPRPESETMIELLKKSQIAPPNADGPYTDEENVNSVIIDVGTGSGALAITAKLEIPSAKVLAVDIDEKCLAVASKNATLLAADVKFYKGDLLEPIAEATPGTSRIILANLPYVPDGFTINPAAMNEPKLAIFGGPDGLNIYRRLFSQINHFRTTQKPSLILCESLPPQHKSLTKIANTSDYRLAGTDDFAQIFSR